MWVLVYASVRKLNYASVRKFVFGRRRLIPYTSWMDRPPNILFLMDDQHRYDVCGFMGNDVVRTPRLDALANSGVVFDNAYTPCPVCVPGRQCIMSGQLPSTNGCQNYGDDLPPFSPTFSRQLAQIGYATVCAGKLHHMGMDQMQGWTHRLGWADMQVHTHLQEGADAEAMARNVPKVEGRLWSLDKEIRKAGPGRNPYAVNDDYSVQGAVDFLSEYFVSPFYEKAQCERPIMLKVSLQRPHYPFVCGEEKFSYYLNRVEPYSNQTAFDDYGARDFTYQPDVSEEEIRRSIAAYYGMVEEVDDAFGLVLDKLDQVGQNLDDWIVVFTTDHGDMLGEHGSWWKLKFYEGSVKVPFFIRAPRWQDGPRRVRENVNLCDIYATLCEAAGAPMAPDRDSRSLLPLLRGDTSGWSDESISETYGKNLMIKRGDLKYLYYGDAGYEVLFDLGADPGETESRLNDPNYATALAELRARRDELRA